MSQEYAEITIHSNEDGTHTVDWAGDAHLPFKVDGVLLREGFMDLLFRYAPFDYLGEDMMIPDRHIFKRKLPQ